MKMLTLRGLLRSFDGPGVPSADATEQDNVMKTVRQWVEGLNEGNTKSAIAACANETSIVDEFPPHEWHGEGACARWVSELEVYNRGLGLTDSHVALGKPRRVDITGGRAANRHPLNSISRSMEGGQGSGSAIHGFAEKQPGWMAHHRMGVVASIADFGKWKSALICPIDAMR